MEILQKVIFGGKPIQVEQKGKFLLTGYFLLIYIGIDIFFLFVNLFNQKAQNIPILIGLFVSVGCLLFLRMGWRNAAIVIQLIRTNTIAFIFISIDNSVTGNFLYFIVSSIGAMALFGYEEKLKGVLFSSVSLVLFYVSTLNIDEFEPGNPHFFLVMNFTIAYIMTFIIIYFLNKLTFFSQSIVVEKNEQLEKVNSELDRFVYSVSHDLRAPLSSISGLIHLIERTRDPKETEQYLNLMKGRIERLDQFIRDIINFSRNARSEIRTENVNMKELVDEAFEALKYIKGAEAILLKNELPSSMMIAVDRTRLQIVLFNIISNAIQYKDTNKAQSYLHFSSEPSKGQVIILIDDNGIGIDYSHHPKMFSMFYRASENAKGSGLGLYIVKETMDKLGGTISLQSVLGEGTRLTLKLPIQAN